MKRLVLTNSEMSTHRACPARWGFGYAEGLEPEEQPRAITIGTLAHAALAAAWSLAAECTPHDPKRARMPDGLGAIGAVLDQALADGADPEVVDVARYCAVTSLERCEEEYRTHLVLAVEREFVMPISAHLAWKGTVDLVTQTPDFEAIVWDHKTTSFTPDVWEHRLPLDTQHIGYTEAVRRGCFGVGLRGGLFRWSVVRSKPPTEPHINKDGRVSAALIDTTPAIYEAALNDQEARGLSVTDAQVARLEAVRARPATDYRRFETLVTDEARSRWLAEIRLEAARIRRALKHPEERTRRPEACSSVTSGRCPFREVCIQPAPETRALYRRKEDGSTTQQARLGTPTASLRIVPDDE